MGREQRMGVIEAMRCIDTRSSSASLAVGSISHVVNAKFGVCDPCVQVNAGRGAKYFTYLHEPDAVAEGKLHVLVHVHAVALVFDLADNVVSIFCTPTSQSLYVLASLGNLMRLVDTA